MEKMRVAKQKKQHNNKVLHGIQIENDDGGGDGDISLSLDCCIQAPPMDSHKH
jgi:hypothetical protein